LHVKKEKAAT